MKPALWCTTCVHHLANAVQASLSGHLRVNEGPYDQARHVMPQHARREGSATCLDSPWCVAALLPPSVLYLGRKGKKHLVAMPSRAPTARFLWLRAAFLMSTSPEPQGERDAAVCCDGGVGCYLLLLAVPYFRDDFCEATGHASFGHLTVSELERSGPFREAVQVM